METASTYKPRFIEKRLLNCAKLFKSVMLLGPRQCGKTTLLRHVFPEVPLVTFERNRDTHGARSDPDGFLKAFPPPLILDEAQYAPELFSTLKRFMDLRDERGQYFITGSQNPLLLREVGESMAGRVAILDLDFMDAPELAGIGDRTPWLNVWLADKGVANSLKYTVLPESSGGALRALWRGGMPELARFDDASVHELLGSYFQTYVERDARVPGEIRSEADFVNFVTLCSALTAQEVNFAKLGRDIGIVPATAKKWFHNLRATFQWRELPAYSRNAVKRLSGKPKGYLSDTGLVCFLQHLDGVRAVNSSPLKGALFETWVVNSLRRQLGTISAKPGCYHWRTIAGAEVDAVLDLGGVRYLVEVKCKTNLDVHDLSGIRAFRKTYNEANAPAVVVYTGDVCRPLDAHTLAMPWNAILNKT
ncbi:MAG: ATP-binding protein [Puniceicoccales bacterium]|nr:ATP-binding protein [Puniceicoccales bacterium]